MIGRTNTGGGGAGGYAFIVADWPVDSTCQAVRSGDGKTLKAKDTSGHFVFRLPKPITAGVAETWTVSCTDGTDNASEAVSITAEGQSESVTLAYNLTFIQSGSFSSSFGHALSGYTTASIDEDYNGLKCLRVYQGKTGNSRTSLYFTPITAFPLDEWRYLVCDFQIRGIKDSTVVPAFGVFNTLNSGGSANPAWVIKQSMLDANTDTLQDRKTMFIDVSGVTGNYYIGICSAGNSSYTGELLCYNFYLSKEAPT